VKLDLNEGNKKEGDTDVRTINDSRDPVDFKMRK
jgi:hypothetical protein